MKKIIEYFTPEQKQSFLKSQKTTAFIIFNFIILFFLIVLIIQAIILPSDDLTLKVVPIVGIFTGMVLFLLKKKGIKIAGNIFSIGLILPLVFTLNSFNQEVSVLFKYIHGFYLVLAILVINGMFASKKILIFNATIIIISTIRVYSFGIEQNVVDTHILIGGFLFHTISLMLTTVILYFIIQFTEKAINLANKDAETNKKQTNTLIKMIAGIKESSEQIFRASEQLSSSSMQISQNANEQAVTTEEISSSMEQILTMVNSNTKNADETGITTTKSANEIQQSQDAFIETIKSVSDINNKTKIITEISDKTDILSINAAIEAARAGDVGKGFAVVAQEIRKLADKTKTASDEITQLSIKGQNISEIAGQKLEKLIPEIVRSAELVNNIILANKEQQKGIEAINESVQQLTEITNENSASAEEMSASAEELSAQAEQLRDLIAEFNSKKNI